MCKVKIKNIYASFNGIDDDAYNTFFLESVYFKPIYTKEGLVIETDMITYPPKFTDNECPAFRSRSWRRYKKHIQRWFK